MPTIFRHSGLRVVIWPNDHRPAHVHVIGTDREAIFNLNCPAGPLDLRESFGFRLGEINDLGDALLHILGLACAEWRRIHGDY
jgi:hypothetical protein